MQAKCGLGQYFGTGSSRLEDVMDEQMAKEFDEIVQDKEHLQEEMDNLFTEEEIEQMRPDQIAFNFFAAHDGDDDVLDGLELYKAIHHARQHEAQQDNMSDHNQEELHNLQSTENDAAMDLADEILKFDADQDGYLNFAEFMTSFEHTRSRLHI